MVAFIALRCNVNGKTFGCQLRVYLFWKVAYLLFGRCAGPFMAACDALERVKLRKIEEVNAALLARASADRFDGGQTGPGGEGMTRRKKRAAKRDGLL